MVGFIAKAIQKVKNVCTHSPRTCSCCSRKLVCGDQCGVENFLMQLYVGTCHVLSAEVAIAMAVPIENPANCEVGGVIRFLQVDENLGYFAEETSSRVDLFCCTTMHVRIVHGRHKPCCVSYSSGTSSSILRTVRTWYHRSFSCFQKWRSMLMVNASQMMKIWRRLVE